MVRLYRPSKNLGCAGLKIGEHFYVDCYNDRKLGGHIGMFIRIKNRRWTVTATGIYPWR